MKKSVFTKFFNKVSVCLITFTLCNSLFAIGVDEAEIKSTSNQTITFENYTGPHSRVDTLEQIKGIGRDLANDFDKNIAKTYGGQRYSVIHAVDSNEDGKLDADIFIIGKDAEVDHIRNVRHIIASYLSKAYEYEYDDAYTIATFATVYNAVYRGKIDYFKGKYKSVVTNNLSSSKVGMSTSYKDWPGNSQIVIPLADLDGGLSTVDTSVISDKKVVESMQEEDNKGIDERKNMVDIKEREAEQAQENAQQAQKKVTEEEKKLKEEQKELASKQAATQQAQKKADEAQKKADESEKKAQEAQTKAANAPQDKQAQENAKVAEQQAQKDKEEAESAQKQADEAKQEEVAQQEVVDKQAESVEEAKEVAQEEQEKADKKQTEAQNERAEIAKDQKEVVSNGILEEKTAAYALKLVDEQNLYSAIVKINRFTGEELKESPVNVIRNRMIYRDGLDFIAIAGETSKTGAVKLVKLDKDNLEIISESKETIADNSVLIQVGADYYCVINEKSKYYVGKFNSNLECSAKSVIQVNPATPIYLSAEGVYVTNSEDKITLLDFNSLEVKK